MPMPFIAAMLECGILAAIALLIFRQATELQNFGESALSAGLFPAIAAGLLLFLSVSLAVQSIRALKKDGQSALFFPQSAPGAGKRHLRALMLFALAIGYTLILPVLHFFAASVAFMVVFLLLAGERRWWAIALVSLGLSGSLQLIFGNLLKVMLPYPKVMAAYFALGGVGSLLATTPLSLMNTNFGWRGTFWDIGIVTGVIAVCAWLVVRDRPQQAAAAAVAPKSVRLIPALKKLFTMRNFWCLLCWHATMAGSFYTFAGLWGGVYLEEVYALSRISIGNMLGMGAIGFILGGPVLAWACAHGLHSHKGILAGAGVLGLGTASALVFFTGSMSEPVLYILVLMLGFAANAPNAICFTIARISFGAELAGTSGGFLGFATFIGGASMQAIIGQILSGQAGADKVAAFSSAFWVLLIAAGISVAAGLLLHETHGKEEQRIAG